MKILMINVVCGIRSTGRICTDLADALTEQGHIVKIAYGREEVPNKYKKYAVKIGTDFDVKLHGVKARLLDASGFGSKKVTTDFIRWVKKYDPDVIHLHNIHGYYINIEILFDYLRSCGKKIIWTLHDCWAFTGHTAYCDIKHCMRWRMGCHHCPLKNEYPKTFFDRSKNNWEKKKMIFNDIPNLDVIVPSEWLAKRVKNSFLKNYPVIVIHNGIDTLKFHYVKNNFRSKNMLENKCLLLGVATSWDDNKGLKDYIELANQLEENFKVVLVGLDNDQMLSLPNNIIKIARTNSVDELVDIYSSCDFFLNLSYCENYPTVNLEAICCGTPVITYDTGGSKESVINGFGYVVKQGDINSVVNIIKSKYLLKKRIHDTDFSNFDNQYTICEYLKIYLSR